MSRCYDNPKLDNKNDTDVQNTWKNNSWEITTREMEQSGVLENLLAESYDLNVQFHDLKKIMYFFFCGRSLQ